MKENFDITQLINTETYSMTVNVLDKGFVRLVDKMGDDYRILEAARISTGSAPKKGDEKDRKLIHYLYRNNHLSPFEQAVFTFHVKMPIFIARQWMRHRTFSFNEFSARYAQMPEEFYLPKKLSNQDKKNHQSSSSPLDEKLNESLLSEFEESCKKSFETYRHFLAQGISREQARMVLPVNLYTQVYMTVNLRNLFHFLKLRLHNHAQWEIRQYASAILKILRQLPDFKWSLEVFDEDNYKEKA